MLLGHLLPELRGFIGLLPSLPFYKDIEIAALPIWVCWLEGALIANKCSELEQIMTDLVILIDCSFQVDPKLVIGYDFLHFSITNTKDIAEVLDSSPSVSSMVSPTFLVTFALNLSPLSPGGSRKVLPTRSSGLNSGKGLFDLRPSLYLDLMKTVGISGCVGLSPFEDEVGYLRGSEWGDDHPSLQHQQSFDWDSWESWA